MIERKIFSKIKSILLKKRSPVLVGMPTRQDCARRQRQKHPFLGVTQA